MLPIGDYFTMGPEGAALACKKFFKSANYVLPMHFDDMPVMTGTYDNFNKELKKNGVRTHLVNAPSTRISVAHTWNVGLKTLH